MNNSTLRALPQPEDKPTDLLTDLLRAGARDQFALAGKKAVYVVKQYATQ
ncbi:TPA: hypothetical protein ACGD2U_004475 [Aeromonas veronii]|nr:hypothetical protein [Aeromonas veronii]